MRMEGLSMSSNGNRSDKLIQTGDYQILWAYSSIVCIALESIIDHIQIKDWPPKVALPIVEHIGLFFDMGKLRYMSFICHRAITMTSKICTSDIIHFGNPQIMFSNQLHSILWSSIGTRHMWKKSIILIQEYPLWTFKNKGIKTIEYVRCCNDINNLQGVFYILKKEVCC